MPIQCVEATFIGSFLTLGLTIDRFPLSFKSVSNGVVYRHMVLAIKLNGKWGAIGISRKINLMFKNCVFSSLADLIMDFRLCYSENFHKLIVVYVGDLLPHSKVNSLVKVNYRWRSLRIKISEYSYDEFRCHVDAFVRGC